MIDVAKMCNEGILNQKPETYLNHKLSVWVWGGKGQMAKLKAMETKIKFQVSRELKKRGQRHTQYLYQTNRNRSKRYFFLSVG